MTHLLTRFHLTRSSVSIVIVITLQVLGKVKFRMAAMLSVSRLE
jgi:hypothetical protein